MPEELLLEQVAAELQAAIDSVDLAGPRDLDRWPDILAEVILPFIRNMRDVRRLSVSIGGTFATLQGKVAMVDVLGLEAFRIFVPDGFDQLRKSVEALTTTGSLSYGGTSESEMNRSAIETIIAVSDPHQEVAEALVKRLFPAGAHHLGGSHYDSSFSGTWLKERRVANKEILRLYLGKFVGEDLQRYFLGELAFELMLDEVSFEHFWKAVEPKDVEGIISSLEQFEEDFTKEHAMTAVAILQNQIKVIPTRPRGFLEIQPRMIIARVVLRLIRPLNPEDAEEVVRNALPQIETLSSRRELLLTVGYQENAGAELISEAAAKELELEWRNQVRAATTDELIQEPDLLRVIAICQKNSEVNEPKLILEIEPRLTLRLTQSSTSEDLSQTLGSRGVSRTKTLAWDPLVEVLGGKEHAALRFQELLDSEVPVETELEELILNYLTGDAENDNSDDPTLT